MDSFISKGILPNDKTLAVLRDICLNNKQYDVMLKYYHLLKDKVHFPSSAIDAVVIAMECTGDVLGAQALRVLSEATRIDGKHI
jgi:hypothetical protein